MLFYNNPERKYKVKFIKTFSVIFLSLILCAFAPFNALAQNIDTTDTDIQYFDDGSYLITESENSINLFSSGTKRHTKTATYYNGNDERQWSATLTAVFSYTGSSVTCTSASTSYTIYDSAWKMKEATASKSGGTATGEFIAKKYWLGIITKTIPMKIITICDNNGNIT